MRGAMLLRVGPHQRARRQAETAGGDDVDVARRHERRHLVEAFLRDDDLAAREVEHRRPAVALVPAGMNVVAQPEVEGEVARDLPVVLREEVVGPARPQRGDRRKRARGRVGHAEQEVGIRMAAGSDAGDLREPAREVHVAEQVCRGVQILPVDTPDLGADLEAVSAAHPRRLVLDLIAPVEESRVAPVNLRHAGQPAGREG